MKTILIVALGLLAAGCSQTTAWVDPGQVAGSAKAGKATAPAKEAPAARTAQARPLPAMGQQLPAGYQPRADQTMRCAEAAKKAADSQMKAAMLGGVLSMAGGLGGFAGTGGMVAAQAASVGGSLVQQQASGKAQAEMRQSC